MIKKKVVEHNMCVLIFYTPFARNSSHPKMNWARYDKKIHIDLHIKYPLFLTSFNGTLISSADFRKIHKYKISWKNVQREPSCSMRTNGQTQRRKDMTELTVAFQNSANVPNIFYFSILIMNQMHTRRTVALHMYISLSVKSLTPTRNSTTVPLTFSP
jgi:hypothetical protein